MTEHQNHPTGGLTSDEQRAMDALTNFMNIFSSLPVQHQHDSEEIVRAVHDIQYRLAARVVRRQYPDYWTNEEEPQSAFQRAADSAGPPPDEPLVQTSEQEESVEASLERVFNLPIGTLQHMYEAERLNKERKREANEFLAGVRAMADQINAPENLNPFLHSREAHPDYEYATTRGPRKDWYEESEPPDFRGYKFGDPDLSWERNIHKGRDGWERFDYHEEAYWMRRRKR